MQEARLLHGHGAQDTCGAIIHLSFREMPPKDASRRPVLKTARLSSAQIQAAQARTQTRRIPAHGDFVPARRTAGRDGITRTAAGSVLARNTARSLTVGIIRITTDAHCSTSESTTSTQSSRLLFSYGIVAGVHTLHGNAIRNTVPCRGIKTSARRVRLFCCSAPAHTVLLSRNSGAFRRSIAATGSVILQ